MAEAGDVQIVGFLWLCGHSCDAISLSKESRQRNDSNEGATLAHHLAAEEDDGRALGKGFQCNSRDWGTGNGVEARVGSGRQNLTDWPVLWCSSGPRRINAAACMRHDYKLQVLL